VDHLGPWWFESTRAHLNPTSLRDTPAHCHEESTTPGLVELVRRFYEAYRGVADREDAISAAEERG
jgi:hypothetical protein